MPRNTTRSTCSRRRVGQVQHAAEVAGVALAAVVVEGGLRQIDEGGVERLHLRRHIAHLALGGHLTAALHQPGRPAP